MSKKEQDIYRVQSNDTYTLYTRNGVKHNVNGPALIIGGTEWYYINGESFTKDMHTRYIDLYKAYEGDPAVEDALYTKASTSTDGIYVDVKGDSPAEQL